MKPSVAANVLIILTLTALTVVAGCIESPFAAARMRSQVEDALVGVEFRERGSVSEITDATLRTELIHAGLVALSSIEFEKNAAWIEEQVEAILANLTAVVLVLENGTHIQYPGQEEPLRTDSLWFILKAERSQWEVGRVARCWYGPGGQTHGLNEGVGDIRRLVEDAGLAS